VAEEVKQLAHETAEATGNISGRIQTIQADAASTAAAISEITAVITQVGDYQTTIAAAVEQQTAATGQISREMTICAAATQQIADHIDEVTGLAATTDDGADQTSEATVELSRMGHQLTEAVSHFTA
jgi:methyl-accepting chemotaxis protein